MAKKIALFDCCRFKFMGDLINHWQEKGHEVKKTLYWDPRMVEWADLTFFDWADNSLIRFSNPEDPLYKELGLTIPKNKHIVCRCHDIDAWCGHYHRINWELVNDLIFVAPHIKDLVLESLKPPANLKIHLIKHGVNTNKYTLRKNPERNNKIAWIGRITHHKCLELALQVLVENPYYELHVAGTSLDSWELAYVNDFVKRNGLKFFYYGEVPDINEWLEDKTYILLTSFKEAFSFVIGESMAKGIKPLIHHFYGAENVWDKKYLWDKVSECQKMLTEYEYNPNEYRDYIVNYYPLERMLKSYDDILFK